MRNAYSYVRMSTDLQRKGDSMRRQLEASTKYASEHGLNLVEHIANTKLHDIGVSAYNGENAKTGALGHFLQALQDGHIPENSILLVESLDRLSRDKITESMGQFLLILGHGIEIVTLADGQSYRKQDLNEKPGALFVSLGVMIRANEESEIKSRRISAVWENKRRQAAKKPMTGICPAWLTLSKETGTFEQVPEKVAVVRQIFERCIQGSGSFATARYLNSEGVPVFGRAKYWHMTYVKKILENRAVLGEFQPKKSLDGKSTEAGPIIEDYFPAIIGENDFNLAMLATRSRKKGAGGRKGENFSNLLHSLLYCGSCGSRMFLKNRGYRDSKNMNFACSKMTAKSSCNMPEWSMTDVENRVIRHLQDVDFSDLFGAEERSKRNTLTEQIALNKENVRASEEKMRRSIAFIQENELPPGVTKEIGLELARLEAESVKYRERLEEAESNLIAETELERQVDSKTIQKLLMELNSRGDDYEFRAKFNNALRQAIDKIVLCKEPFYFEPMEYSDDDPRVIAFRNEKPSRNKLSLRDVLSRKKFEFYCDSLCRRIKIHYKTGAVKIIDIETGIIVKNNLTPYRKSS